ncbi:UMP kinase [Candidatus Saccharibacteria bacterium]|nr:UMP kinase [Candidatus Saccharibacteria bacterium]
MTTSPTLRYKRLFLKLSGEQLAGKYESGVDPEVIAWIAKELKLARETGVEIVVMVGGGNFVRGAQVAGHGLSRVNADFMGMLGTVMNGLAVTDIFNACGVPTRLLSNVKMDQIADQFTTRRANSHLSKGRIVVIGGGTGRPYLTTDTAAVNLALELDCDVVCKVTKVDGVYDRDPAKHDDAVKYDHLSFQEAVSNPAIAVMDKAAMGLAMEHDKAIIIFDLHRADNIRRVAIGDSVGTVIS